MIVPNKICFLFALLLYSYSNVNAQLKPNTNNKCYEELKHAYAEERDFLKNVLASSKAFNSQYVLTALVKQPGSLEYTPSSVTGKIMSTDKVRYVKEGNVEIYMDSLDIFTLNKDDMSLLRIKSPKGAIRQQNNQFFDVASPDFLKVYTVSACSIVYDSALHKDLKVFTVIPVLSNRSVFVKMLVFYDVKAKMIRKTQLWFNTEVSEDIKMQTVVFNDRSVIEKSEIPYPVRSVFLTGNSQLKPVFKKYDFKDLTKKNKKM